MKYPLASWSLAPEWERAYWDKDSSDMQKAFTEAVQGKYLVQIQCQGEEWETAGDFW